MQDYSEEITVQVEKCKRLWLSIAQKTVEQFADKENGSGSRLANTERQKAFWCRFFGSMTQTRTMML